MDKRYRTVVDYFVVGSANFIDESTKHRHSVPRKSLRFHWADSRQFGGFAAVELEERVGLVTYYQANGTVLYNHRLEPRHR